MAIYMGGINLGAQKAKEMRAFQAAVDEQKRAFAEAAGKRKMWDYAGDIAEKLLPPGLGQAVDLGIDYMSAKHIKGGDPAALSNLQLRWGRGEAQEASKELAGMIEGVKPDFLSMALEKGVDFMEGEAGDAFAEQVRGLFKGSTKPEIGVELTEAAKTFDPLEYLTSESRAPRLGREKIYSSDIDQEYSPLEFRRPEGTDYFQKAEAPEMRSKFNLKSSLQDYFTKKSYDANTGEYKYFKQGGEVPNKYYGGGMPTIADYFGAQGKTLGGSNKQSIAEMLGKK
jgi:hypothetical protein